MRFLYKYPQAAYPYAQLVEENRRRGCQALEYELLDTGVFDADRSCDVFVEYAKATPEDTLIRIHVINRGPETAPLHLLPTVWFRNTWTWGYDARRLHVGAGEPLRNLKAIGLEHDYYGQRQPLPAGPASSPSSYSRVGSSGTIPSPQPAPYQGAGGGEVGHDA
jgi:hypothetical protein